MRTGQPSLSLHQADTDAIRPRNHFKCFADWHVEAEIVTICQLLGYYGNLQVLIDHFMDLFAQSTLHRKQAAFCIGKILTGVVSAPIGLDLPLTAQRRDPEELEYLVRLSFCSYLYDYNYIQHDFSFK